ncbi:MAG: LTA synthase family protein [Planctomycetota bacterium]
MKANSYHLSLGGRALASYGRVLLVPSIFAAWLIVKQWLAVRALGMTAGGYMLPATAGLIVVLTALSSFGRGRLRLLGYLLVNVTISLVAFADIIYYREFRDVTSVASLPFAWQLGTVRSAWLPLIQPSDIWLWSDSLLMGACLLLPGQRLDRWLPAVPERLRVIVGAVGALLVGGTFLVFPYLFASTMHHARWIGKIGPLNYHLVDITTYVSRHAVRMTDNGPATAETLAWLAHRRDTTPPGPLRGVARGKNAIILQVESLHAFAVGLTIGGQDVTPNLNRLISESILFTNFYDQTGQGLTADADLLGNCSLLPMARGAVYFNYANNDFYCIPQLLEDHDYTAVALQGMQADFWNYSAIYPQIGFERYYSEDDFVIDEVIGLGLSDESFLRQSVHKLTALEEPFYAFMVTLTNHTPYNFEGLPQPLKLGRLAGTTVGHYLQAVHYTDKAIGGFLALLESKKLLDRCVLVLYGDHTGIRRSAHGMADLLRIPPGRDDLWTRAERRLPLVIRLPDGAHAGVRTQTCGAADVGPTLLALLDISTESAAFLGRDLFATKEGTVALSNGSAIGDQRLFLRKRLGKPTGTCYEAATGKILPTEECSVVAEEAAEQRRISRNIIRRNLIPDLRGVREVK